MRLPKVLTVVAIGSASCSAPSQPADAGMPDAGIDAGAADSGFDAGAMDAGTLDAGADDGGCHLPSDFPYDSGFAFLEQEACQCIDIPEIFHCFEENGPRCFSWACPPAKNKADGGYVYFADGGIECLC